MTELALQPGDTVRIRRERWIVQRHTTYELGSALDVRGADAGNGGRRARFLLPFEPVERVIPPRVPKVVRPTQWRTLTRAALASATPQIDSLRAAARARFTVMPYQLEPALAITGGVGCRLLIADEVGLGKTVQAGLIIAELLERQPDSRALVVCPAGLRQQWQEELQTRFELAPTLLDAGGLARVAAEFDATTNPWSACRLAIVSMDFIKRPEVLRAIEGLVWDVIVLDEAHNLATRSDRAAAATALAVRARTTVMLSATPHSGDTAAFERLCSIGDITGRFPLTIFRRTRADAGVRVQRRTHWLHVRPTAAEAQMVDALVAYANGVWRSESVLDAARLAMTVLLRRASSSASSLARSVERRLALLAGFTPSSTAQLALPFSDGSGDEEPVLALGAPGLAHTDEERRQLERLLSLAKNAAFRESKVAALLRFLARVDEPVLVFTEYRDTVAHLRQSLIDVGLSESDIAELHGGLTRVERRAAESGFASGHTRVLLATDAASEGLNLHQRCRCVVNVEIPWNPVRLEQRIGRVDRIGQHRRVHALNLVAAGTHEVTTVRRIAEREQRATAALRGTPTSEISLATTILTGIESTVDHTVDAPESSPRPELSQRAAAEADWISMARCLDSGSLTTTRRPVLTARRTAASRLIWIGEVSICDASGSPVWTSLIALELPVRVQLRRCRDIRNTMAAFDPGLNDIAARFGARPLLMTAGTRLHAATRLAAERERAICGAIRVRHARIAAELLQPGLFDRRAERHAAAQTAVLEEALAHCHGRLDGLARMGELTVTAPTLRFAIFA